jgi:hypothetical protein
VSGSAVATAFKFKLAPFLARGLGTGFGAIDLTGKGTAATVAKT